MDAAELIARFRQEAPVALMTQGVIEFVLSPAFLDPVAEQARSFTYTQQIHFHHLIELLLPVIFDAHPSVRAAYRHTPAFSDAASLKSFYSKLDRTEPAVAAALVAAVADRVGPLLVADAAAEPLPGLRLVVLDGNKLAATQRRLDGLEQVPAPLPGQALALYEYRTGLFLRMLPCEDAYTNERRLLGGVFTWLAPGDCLVADSNFCTLAMFDGVQARGGCFVIRHHGAVALTPVSARTPAVRVEGGWVSEEWVVYGQSGRRLRCVVVDLDEPTQDGQTQVRVLTDVPVEQADAATVAAVYLRRRTIENAFQDLACALRSEVDTLAYPRAALLGLAVGLVVYNLLRVVRAAAAAGPAVEVSAGLLAQEVAAYLPGLRLLGPGLGLPGVGGTVEAMRQWLLDVAAGVDWRRYRKSPRAARASPRGFDGQPPNRHVSTARHLLQRKGR